MAQQKCKKCGNWFSEEGSEPSICSACSPKGESTEVEKAHNASLKSVGISDSTPSASSATQDDSSGAAISLLEFVNTINAVCGAILMAVFLIGGFATDQAFYGIAGALVMALITAIVWAANQVFIGIAKDVRAIRQKS